MKPQHSELEKLCKRVIAMLLTVENARGLNILSHKSEVTDNDVGFLALDPRPSARHRKKSKLAWVPFLREQLSIGNVSH